MDIVQTYFTKALAITLGVVVAALSFVIIPALAHQDPALCSANGVGLSLTVFRADGTTSVGGGSIAPGETVKYQATLSHLGGANCNYEGGTLSITTPDGVVHVVASPATPVVPLVSTSSPFVSSQVTYVANSADVGGDNDLDSAADYAGGISHTGDNHDTASAHVDVAKLFAKLNPGIVTHVHNSSHTDITGSSTPQGTVVHDQVTVSATSTGPTPGGTVDFVLMSGGVCDGTILSTQSDVALVGGTIESNATTTGTGTFSYSVHYDGDANYNGGTAQCEPFTIAAQKGHIIVVKQTTPDATSTSFEFDTNYGSNFFLSDGEQSDSGALDAGTYSVAEINIPANWQMTGATCSDQSPVNAISLQAGETVTCTFNNTFTPPPPPRGEWCSHGYWKQKQHFDSWVGFSPNQQFSSVFDNAFPGMTLLQVLQQGGGGLNALGRDTVGELLNTAAGLNTGFTTAQIISMFNDVFPGTKSQYNALHAQFVAPENCPLN